MMCDFYQWCAVPFLAIRKSGQNVLVYFCQSDYNK